MLAYEIPHCLQTWFLFCSLQPLICTRMKNPCSVQLNSWYIVWSECTSLHSKLLTYLKARTHYENKMEHTSTVDKHLASKYNEFSNNSNEESFVVFLCHVIEQCNWYTHSQNCYHVSNCALILHITLCIMHL